MAILITPFSYSPQASSLYLRSKLHNINIYSTYGYRSSTPLRSFVLCSSQQQISPQPILIDKSILSISEAKSENELWAASCLRVRTFYGFQHDTLNTEFSQDNAELVVVGTLDINQCIRLPDEITGMKPKGIGADFARGYVSNVCVAKEMQRNGLGCALIAKAKTVAKEMGISDLYVHVAIDNEPAKKLYMKCGFVYENEEPAWQARFLDRPRRLLLWTDLSNS
ncbi:PREDICTED: uncharacterized protein LOC109234559 isoform X2 [Nicotiana attenuata]|uniref:uncharacterized protein LOC109234559 isoform X2 n=1 Tax=Nicotiana attenuata TaxID=49451 RepID=UPI000905BE2F|nr:PREDICTED: uncharacterized protein LOC109234559 isoform X2 [Nicotiana attenuata]